MNALAKIGTAARVFCVAAVLGLSLAFLDSSALQGVVFLAAVAGLAIAADLSARVAESWLLAGEATLVALVVGISLPQGLLLLPYLVVPALVAGLSAGERLALGTVVIETIAIAALVATGDPSALGPAAEVVGPWLLTALGVGLLGARVRGMRALIGGQHDPSYESARRLLAQLRTVARRLSSGLDIVTLASDLLQTVHQHLADTNSAVFMRTEAGVMAPMGYRGLTAKDSIHPEGTVLADCLATMEPAHSAQESGSADRRYRIALPLRVGSRVWGAVIAERGEPPAPKTLRALMMELDEHALRLDAALTFDEVRSLATTQERYRLAREIHDGVAQEIASLGYLVDELLAGATSDMQRTKLAQLRSETSRIVNELRLSIFDLRTEVSAGLGSAISEYVREVGTRSGLTVHTTLDEAPTRLRGEVETELFRIAQEAITNARKHSSARNLWVDCRIRPPAATISVRDDGTGLGRPRVDSFGLKVMRERASRINATLEITSGDGTEGPSGTCVTVRVGAGPISVETRARSAEV